MNNADRIRIVTTEDLIRRYNLDNLKTDRVKINNLYSGLQNQYNIIKKFIQNVAIYTDQTDSTVWFYNGLPDITKEPFVGYIDLDKANIYYDRDSGKAYILENNTWTEIENDSELLNSLSIASSEADAQDNKRNIFYTTPYPKYQVGDIWVNGTNLMRCRCSRDGDSFNEVEWVYQNEYSDSGIILDVRAVLNQLETTVETNYETTSRLETTVETITGEVTGLTTQVNSLNGEVILQREDISNLQITTTSIETNVTQRINGQDAKISQTLQTVDEINDKIGEIADTTTSGESDFATIDLENINISEPIALRVHPVNENISYLYPRNNLYPSDTLYIKTRKIRFNNTTTSEIFDYELPDDLLYYDTDTYDEFLLDLETQTCQITKKCGYNADGTVKILDNEVTNSYSYPTISLTDGDYTISILGYTTGYLYARLMTSNIYTTQYATKVELNSSINQTSTSIMSQVSATYSTKNELQTAQSEISQTINTINLTVSNNNTKANIIAKINDNTSIAKINADVINISANDVLSILSHHAIDMTGETISIESTGFKVTPAGAITATSGKIGGWNIGSNTLSSSYVTLNSSTGSNTNAINVNSGAFKVTNSGAVTASNITATGGKIAGFTINGDTLYGSQVGMDAESGGHYAFWAGASLNNTGNAPFRVGHDGGVVATNANITGEITATSGSIGGLTITNDRIYMGDCGITSNTGAFAFWAGETNNKHGSSSSNAPFKVGHDGTLVATGAIISGQVTATSGSFTGSLYSSNGTVGGWNLKSSGLYGTSGGTQYTIRPYGIDDNTHARSIGWGQLISSSDERLKNNISDIAETYEALFDSLKPKSFYYNEGIDEGNKHFGFIAQDVIKIEEDIKEKLSMVTLGGNYYNLNKQEIIALNTWQIQKLKKQFNELINKLTESEVI